MRNQKSNLIVAILLGLFIILRIPSLYEPHWYGDEGIYASVAYALEHGKKMYVSVFDNRLPGVYFLYSLGASESRLLYIKIMSLIAGLITIIGVYKVAAKLQLKEASFIALIVAVWLLGSPKWEGNIANTENFFLPFTVWGAWFLLSTKRLHLFIAGLLFGTAFLIKFPPFFTFIAMGLYALISGSTSLKERLYKGVSLGLGFAVPIVFAFTVLFFIGNLKEAVQFGLLNNTSYVTSYSEHAAITSEMKLLGLGTVFIVSVLLYLKKIIPNTFFFILLFISLDYFAAIFSGRKYEHYLLQMVPSISLLIGYVALFLRGKSILIMKIGALVLLFLALHAGKSVFYQGAGIAIQMKVGAYYQEFLTQISGHTPKKYQLPFVYFKEPIRLQIAKKAVKDYKTNDIFFYTNESWVYDYTQIVPPTFYVAMYHQYLVPDGQNRLVKELSTAKPQVAVIDKKIERTNQLNDYIKKYYILDKEDEYFMYYLLQK